MFTLVPGHHFFKEMTCFLGWRVYYHAVVLSSEGSDMIVREPPSVRQRDRWLPVFEGLHA